MKLSADHAVFRAQFPQLYVQAFGSLENMPGICPADIRAKVMRFDCSYTCRGESSAGSSSSRTLQLNCAAESPSLHETLMAGMQAFAQQQAQQNREMFGMLISAMQGHTQQPGAASAYGLPSLTFEADRRRNISTRLQLGSPGQIAVGDTLGADSPDVKHSESPDSLTDSPLAAMPLVVGEMPTSPPGIPQVQVLHLPQGQQQQEQRSPLQMQVDQLQQQDAERALLERQQEQPQLQSQQHVPPQPQIAVTPARSAAATVEVFNDLSAQLDMLQQREEDKKAAARKAKREAAAEAQLQKNVLHDGEGKPPAPKRPKQSAAKSEPSAVQPVKEQKKAAAPPLSSKPSLALEAGHNGSWCIFLKSRAAKDKAQILQVSLSTIGGRKVLPKDVCTELLSSEKAWLDALNLQGPVKEIDPKMKETIRKHFKDGSFRVKIEVDHPKDRRMIGGRSSYT